MSAPTELRERDRLAGDISQHLYDEFCGETRFRFGGQDYELVGTDELGLPHDPYGPLIMRRKSDGKLFELELDASVYEFKPPKGAGPEASQETPAQEPLPGVTG